MHKFLTRLSAVGGFVAVIALPISVWANQITLGASTNAGTFDFTNLGGGDIGVTSTLTTGGATAPDGDTGTYGLGALSAGATFGPLSGGVFPAIGTITEPLSITLPDATLSGTITWDQITDGSSPSFSGTLDITTVTGDLATEFSGSGPVELTVDLAFPATPLDVLAGGVLGFSERATISSGTIGTQISPTPEPSALMLMASMLLMGWGALRFGRRGG